MAAKKKSVTTTDNGTAPAPKGATDAGRAEALKRLAAKATPEATVSPTVAPGAKEAKDPAKGTKPKSAPKAAKTPKPEKAPKAPKEKKPKKVSGLDAVAMVLAMASKPLNMREVFAEIQSKGLWKTSGATPEATLYAACIREIAAKGKDSRFKKHDRGLFTAAKVA